MVAAAPVPVPTLADLWEQFAAHVIPPEASAVQRKEMRRAFYQGANATLGSLVIIGKAVAAGQMHQLAQQHQIMRMLDEMQTFAANVAAGKA